MGIKGVQVVDAVKVCDGSDRGVCVCGDRQGYGGPGLGDKRTLRPSEQVLNDFASKTPCKALFFM